VETFDGKSYVLERWLKADTAIVKAEVGDRMGNLTYRFASRNFNPLMCMAAKNTIAQVSSGGIEPEQVITPGLFVNSVVEVSHPEQEEDLVRAGAAYA